MHGIIAEYGPIAIPFAFAGVLWLGHKLAGLIESKTIRDYAGRFFDELVSATREVGEGYVSALKEFNADGKLTKAEKSEALSRAIRVAKSNFGTKGLKRLSKVFNVDEWAANKVEAILGEDKRLGKSLVLPRGPRKSGEVTTRLL